MNGFINRIIRAAKLDTSVYEEVEADKKALRQAMGVVILSNIAFGIGFGSASLREMIPIMIMGLVAWYVWAYIIYFIGTRFLPEPETKADHGELLRTLGFASSPGLIRVFGIIPGLSNVIFLVVSLWMLIAMVIAVRQALDYKSTLRATFVCVLGWVFYMFVIILFSLIGKKLRGA